MSVHCIGVPFEEWVIAESNAEKQKGKVKAKTAQALSYEL